MGGFGNLFQKCSSKPTAINRKAAFGSAHMVMLFKPVKELAPISSGGPIHIVGNLIATSYDERVLVSDIESGQVLHDFEGDGESISALVISPDKQTVVAASRSFQLHIFSLETNALVKTFPKAHETAIMSVTIDATSTLAASGGAEGAVKVWDLRNHIMTHNLKGHGGLVSALAFYGQLGSSDWRLASGSDNGKLIVWDLVKSRAAANLDNHTSAVTSVQWTSKGDSLISGGRDKVVTIWPNLKLGATIPVMEEVEAVGTIQGKIYTGSPQTVRVWSLSADIVGQWDLGSEESEIIAIVHDHINAEKADYLWIILSDQTIIELHVDETGSISPRRTLSTNHGEIIDLLIPSGGTRAALATNSKDIRVIDLSANLLEFVPLVGHTDIVIAIDVLGKWLLSGGKDKDARLWDMETGECKMTFSGHTGSIGAVSLSRGGGNIPQFALTGSQDLTIKKWAADGTAEYTRKAHDKDINTLDVSASNTHFASGSQDRTIKIWSVQTGEVTGLLKGHKRGVWSVKFAPQNTLISGSGDKTVKIWSLSDFTCIKTFEGHTSSVLKVISLSSSNVASAAGDGLVKVWDTKTSEAVATLDGHEDKVWSLTKTDQNELVSGGGDGVLKVWQDCSEEEQQRLDHEEEEMLEKQQELENCVRMNEWDKAIKLALELNRPLRLLKLFTEVADNNEPGSISGTLAVDDVVQNLEGKKLITLMERIRDWNTNGRTSITAQRLLHTLLKAPDAHTKLNNAAMLRILQGLIPYTKRHMARTEEMIETSYIIDYTLKEMTL